MSISTLRGDDGSTGLWSGERIGKDSLRVECYGTVDELNSFLGDARRHTTTGKAGAMIDELQRDLFRVAGALATLAAPACPAAPSAPSPGAASRTVVGADAERLTDWVHELEAAVPLKGFVIPGSTDSSAKLDICRTVCRRAERRIVELSRTEPVASALLSYMNRLSDLLFMLARYEEAQVGAIRYR
jgi:ATP:cob(I)alamin adenosyltransferase